MLLLLGAFVAGLLTVLAPCVLPLLPIIIGGSVTGNAKDTKRPFIIVAALAVSLIIFTVLLKATSLLINIPPQSINYISGGIILLLGILILFPVIYTQAIGRLGIEHRAQALLGKGYKIKSSLYGPIIIGAALGPVFSSCSPVYAYILATILPANFGQAMVYIIAYVLGLSLVLLLIGYYGQRLVGKIRFASNPKGWFQRALAIIFIVVGLLICTGSAVKVQTWVSGHTPFNFDALSAKLIPAKGPKIDTSKLLNVQPVDAPELVGLQDWINSQPLTLARLKAEHKVVLIDFWTYSCINCIRADTYTKGYAATYRASGLVVIGVHAPEFAFEKIPANVAKAVQEAGITYPVALDNNLDTWNAFGNQYWPANYLIDANGQVRRVHYGEGQYNETEQAIRLLLKEAGNTVPAKLFTTGAEQVPSNQMETPETYFGSARAENYSGSPSLTSAGTGTSTNFTATNSLQQDHWTLGGTWEVQADKIISRGNSTLRFRTASKDVYLVGGADADADIGANTGADIGITLNGKPVDTSNNAGSDTVNGLVHISDDRLYRIISHAKFDADSTLELTVPDGVEINTCTFGS